MSVLRIPRGMYGYPASEFFLWLNLLIATPETPFQLIKGVPPLEWKVWVTRRVIQKRVYTKSGRLWIFLACCVRTPSCFRTQPSYRTVLYYRTTPSQPSYRTTLFQSSYRTILFSCYRMVIGLCVIRLCSCLTSKACYRTQKFFVFIPCNHRDCILQYNWTMALTWRLEQ